VGIQNVPFEDFMKKIPGKGLTERILFSFSSVPNEDDQNRNKWIRESDASSSAEYL
jgi:hypothetical protein